MVEKLRYAMRISVSSCGGVGLALVLLTGIVLVGCRQAAAGEDCAHEVRYSVSTAGQETGEIPSENHRDLPGSAFAAAATEWTWAVKRPPMNRSVVLFCLACWGPVVLFNGL